MNNSGRGVLFGTAGASSGEALARQSMPSIGVQAHRVDQGRQLAPEELNPFQTQTIELFVRAADALSLPRSAGQVYGLLFSTPRPLNLDEMTAQLNASRGGTWEGLDWLRQMGAVEKVFLPGVRKDHYRAEVNLRKLATGILRLRIEPHLDNGTDHLHALSASVDESGPDAEFQRTRLGKVETWHRLLNDLLPMIKQIAAD